MEIEAKFRAPDAAMLDRLGEATHLAGYPIFAGRTEQLGDTYLDTERWQMLAAGYACRRRLVEGHILISVKQVLGPADVVHRREELQVDLPADIPPSEWPESEARSRVLEILGDQPLKEMLSLGQTRSTRWVGTIDRPLAEISLDEVHLEPSETVFHEVEVELMQAGTEDDLAALVGALSTEWALEPEPLSKFERALAASGLGPVFTQAPEGPGAVSDTRGESPVDSLVEPPAEMPTEAPPEDPGDTSPVEGAEAPPESQMPPENEAAPERGGAERSLSRRLGERRTAVSHSSGMAWRSSPGPGSAPATPWARRPTSFSSSTSSG